MEKILTPEVLTKQEFLSSIVKYQYAALALVALLISRIFEWPLKRHRYGRADAPSTLQLGGSRQSPGG
jgi:hypothetical protein